MAKYELSETSKTVKTKTGTNSVVHRIRALEDFSDVLTNDLGGWVSGLHNLSQDGNCWLYDDACVFESGYVSENAKLYDTTYVSQFAQVSGSAILRGSGDIYESGRVYDNVLLHGSGYQVFGMMQIYENAQVHCTPNIGIGRVQLYGEHSSEYNPCLVHGNAIISGYDMYIAYGEVYGNAFIFNSIVATHAKVYGDTIITGFCIVSSAGPGYCEVYENAQLYDKVLVYGSGKVHGNARIHGSPASNSRVYDNAKVCGNSVVSGLSWVYENAIVSGNAFITGASRIYGDAVVSGDAFITGASKIYGSSRVYDLVYCSGATVLGNSLLFNSGVVTESTINGNVQVYENADISDHSSIAGNAKIYGSGKVRHNSVIGGDSEIYENAQVIDSSVNAYVNYGEGCKVYGSAIIEYATLAENAEVFDNAYVASGAIIAGSAKIYNNSIVYGYYDEEWNSIYPAVYGNAQVYENATVVGLLKIYDSAEIYGNATISGGHIFFDYDEWELYEYPTEIYGSGKVFATATVYGESKVYDWTWVYGTTNASGAIIRLCSRVDSEILVSGNEVATACSDYCNAPKDEFLPNVYQDHSYHTGISGNYLWSNILERVPNLYPQKGFNCPLEPGRYTIDFKNKKIYSNVPSEFHNAVLVWDKTLIPSGTLLEYDINPLNDQNLTFEKFFLYLTLDPNRS